jgi:hypothetical protein
MTVPTQENQAQDQKLAEKDQNFRALQQKHQRELEQERAEKEQLKKELESRARLPYKDDDEDDSEPYVDHKRLKKEQAKFGEQIKQQTQTEIQRAVQQALNEERRQNWMKNNSDFNEVMQHTEKFAMHDPELAETILQMPEGFERTKLVYKNIKALGLHKTAPREPSIQERIDANRKSPYYQPAGVGAAPYSQASDYSDQGQKQAYEKMQALKKQLRI